MFLHREKLDPALAPSDYSDPAVFEQERALIFASQWHLVGAQGVLSAPGGQIALELDGIPVLVRNDGGTLVAFRNVCPHRHSLLVAPGEHVAATLQCRYHGWQFRADGRLAVLPDGASFRGFKSRDACLESYRVETIGPLVFVNLSSTAPSLRDAFGPLHDELQTHLAGLTVAFRQRTEHDANWKIAVENALESYHIPQVHPETFKNYLPAEQQEHELAPTHSRYWSTEPLSLRARLALRGFALMLRTSRAQRYQQILVFPNYLIAYWGIYVEIACILPLSAQRFRRESYGFLPTDVRRNPLSFALDLAHRQLTKRQTAAIVAEDASAWPFVHQGMQHSPFRGVLSIREERVHHFQQYVAARLGRPESGSADCTRAAQ